MKAFAHHHKKILFLTLWGIAFGYIEAAIVIYLRELYYPGGFSFPVVFADDAIAAVEIIREFATLILIWATAALSYPSGRQRFSAFMILFGVWDIFYYIFLKLFLDWPASFFTWDILFLIPTPWVGPVWAPIVVSIGLITAGTIILFFSANQKPLKLTKLFWIIEWMCGLIIIISFLIPGIVVYQNGIPDSYPWFIFWAGYLTGIFFFIRMVYLSTTKKQL